MNKHSKIALWLVVVIGVVFSIAALTGVRQREIEKYKHDTDVVYVGHGKVTTFEPNNTLTGLAGDSGATMLCDVNDEVYHVYTRKQHKVGDIVEIYTLNTGRSKYYESKKDMYDVEANGALSNVVGIITLVLIGIWCILSTKLLKEGDKHEASNG